MTTFTIPEEIIGVPLWVPSANDFFSVEAAGMPNSDPCLVVHGDISDTYKAFMQAPTMAVDIFNQGEMFAAQEWSMSCWLNLRNLLASGSGDVMLGCSTYNATGLFAHDRNVQTPLLLGPSGTNGFQYFRECLNNVASPSTARSILATGASTWDGFQDYWHLFVFNCVVTGSFNPVGSVYLDTYPAAFASDGANGTTPSGAFGSPRYVHLGAYNNGGTGRADEWRVAKWAFHDHQLSQAERLLMYQTMMGTFFIYTDDFNRAALGTNWKIALGSAFDILANQARGAGNTSRRMYYVRDLTSPDMYAQCDVYNLGWEVFPIVRQQAGGGNVNYSGGYSPLWGGWVIQRNGSNIAGPTGAAPPTPHTVILEAETNGSNNVDLRVYEVVAGIPTLRLSFTDSSGSKLLTGQNGGMVVRGNGGGGGDGLADNFSTGML